MAYADDVLVFLTNPDELRTLLAILNLYGRASNARLNREKTVAVSLNNCTHTTWIHILQAEGISNWFDRTPSIGTAYLGYPLTSSKAQLQAFLEMLLRKHALTLSFYPNDLYQ
ncbi:hypothetical protein VTP01DRAFT_2352 [Rhizomucor pusillus]|uniref:uncharacterized protein n=1 Tax=Rhizomucor pusillus TaxID=4840 RepID=UPI003742BA7B